MNTRISPLAGPPPEASIPIDVAKLAAANSSEQPNPTLAAQRVSYLARTEHLTVSQFNKMVKHKSDLLRISETSSDLSDLRVQEPCAVRAAQAVELSCDHAKKWIGSFAAALGGLGTLVFAGGIDENAPVFRVRIRGRLGFPGIPEAQLAVCAADFIGYRSRQRAGHPHRGGTHDCEVRHARPPARLN